MAIAWRFFTEYLAIGMGLMVAVKMLGWGVTEEIYDKEPDPDENIVAYMRRESDHGCKDDKAE